MIMIGIFVSCTSWHGKLLLNNARFVTVTITGQISECKLALIYLLIYLTKILLQAVARLVQSCRVTSSFDNITTHACT